MTAEREAQGWTQTELAALADVDVETLPRLESGECLPTPDEALRLAAVLRVMPRRIWSVSDVVIDPKTLKAAENATPVLGYWYADADVIADIPVMPAETSEPVAAHWTDPLRESAQQSLQAAHFIGSLVGLNAGVREGRAEAMKAPLPTVRAGSPAFGPDTVLPPPPELAAWAPDDAALRASLVDPASAATLTVDGVLLDAEALGRRRGRIMGWYDTQIQRVRAAGPTPDPHQAVAPVPEAPVVEAPATWRDLLDAAASPESAAGGRKNKAFRYWDTDVVVDIPPVPPTPKRNTTAEWTEELDHAARQTPQAAYLLASVIGFAAGYQDGRREAMARGVPRPSAVRAPKPVTARGRHGNLLMAPLPHPPYGTVALDRVDAVLRAIAFGGLSGAPPLGAPRTTEEILDATETLSRARGRVAGWNQVFIHQARVGVLGRSKVGDLELTVAGPSF